MLIFYQPKSHETLAIFSKTYTRRDRNTAPLQQQLAELVGIKFQQIQKYETGANRVSASRLWDISDALGVPVSFFFEGLQEDDGAAEKSQVPDDLMGDKEALDLVRSYYAIPENQRRRLFELARVLSDVA